MERIVAASPGRAVVDVGCGTGIAARQFRVAGCRVLGVDPDARMASLARQTGVEVEVATFEAWDPAGRAFDAVIAAQAWHWVDPVAGAAKAAQALRPGGRLAVFWSAFQPPPGLVEAFAAVYRRVQPGLPVNPWAWVAPTLGPGAKRMRRRLTELAHDEGVTIASKPRRSKLLEKHLPDPGGYLFMHCCPTPAATQAQAALKPFYGRPGSPVIDVDIKGLHHVRAYWMSVSIRLYVDLCDLAGPVLGWPEWDTLTGQTRTEMQPLAQEAQHRYLGRIQEEMANMPTGAGPPVAPDSCA